jgi:hypothetical protein
VNWCNPDGLRSGDVSLSAWKERLTDPGKPLLRDITNEQAAVAVVCVCGSNLANDAAITV